MFRTTRWSLVIETRADTAGGRVALEGLCRVYRAPVLSYLRARGYSGSDAEDATQAFFEQLLRRRMHAAADPERGRFRTFLLTALQRFLANQHEYSGALKRGGGQDIGSLDNTDEVADERAASPEDVFERDYALTVVARALQRLRDEAVDAGKAELFAHVSRFVMEPPDASEYAALAERLGMRRNTLAVTIHRLRSRLIDMIRGELRQTVDSPSALGAEMAALRNTLANAAPESTQAAMLHSLDPRD